MIKHLPSPFLVCSSAMLACLLLAGAPVHAQNKLLNKVYTATDASGFKGDIDDFINKQLTILKGGGGAKDQEALAQQIKDARDALIQPMSISGATPSFIQVYSTSLAADMAAQGMPAAPDVRTRLNAAIIVYRVAIVANSPALANLAAAFAQDKSEAVALWGVKAAQPLIPALLQAPGGNAALLAAAVIGAVKTNVTSEQIPEDAYNALTMGGGSRMKGITGAMLKPYMQQPLDLLDFRVGLYQTDVPKSPAADVLGTAFMASSTTWGVMTVKQQSQAANLMVTLANSSANQLTDPKPELIYVIKRDAQALQNIGHLIGDSTLENAAKDLATVGDNSLKDEVLKKINPVEDAVKARFSATSVAGQ